MYVQILKLQLVILIWSGVLDNVHEFTNDGSDFWTIVVIMNTGRSTCDFTVETDNEVFCESKQVVVLL